jgi:hypothetical protein
VQLANTMQERISNPPVNLSSVNSSLALLQSALDAVNITSIRVGLANFNASLWNPDIIAPVPMINAMTSLNSTVVGLWSQLGQGIVALDTFSGTLRCLGQTTPCTTSGSTASPCDAGHVCTPAVRTCIVDASTVCSRDADCSSLTCPFNGPVFTATSTALTAYIQTPGADALVSSMAPLAAALNSGTNAIRAVPSLASFNSSIQSVLNNLDAVPVSSSIADIAKLRTQLSPSELNLDLVTDSVSSAQTTIDSVNLASVREKLVSLDSTISGVKSLADSLATRVNIAGRAINKFFNVTIPANLVLVSAMCELEL